MGARRNIPTKKEKQRRRLVAEGQEPPSHAEVRFSARRSRQVTNYNEDEEEEDPFAADEDDLPPNYWATAVEDTGPAIDKILDHRPKSDIGMYVAVALFTQANLVQSSTHGMQRRRILSTRFVLSITSSRPLAN